MANTTIVNSTYYQQPLSSYWVTCGASESGILLSADNTQDLMSGFFHVECTKDKNLLPGEKWATYHEMTPGDEIMYFVKGCWPEFDSEIERYKGETFGLVRYDVGKDVYARTVYAVDFPRHFKFKMGVTVHNINGGWSSYPPHKFELDSLSNPVRPFFHEIFAYLTYPQYGWGIQVSNESSWFVTNRMISEIPLGSHPIVASPETKLAYIWIYAGGEEKFVDGQRI